MARLIANGLYEESDVLERPVPGLVKGGVANRTIFSEAGEPR